MSDREGTGGSGAPSGWEELAPGTRISVAKLAPDGAETARYAGEVIANRDPGHWLVVRTRWTYRQITLDGLSFVPGDTLLEWFSPEVACNAFAIFSSHGDFRGWYANVARPAQLFPVSAANAEPLLVWHDLYLDLVALRNGRWVLRDADELAAAGLEKTDPALLAHIESAGAELQRRFASSELPFVAEGELRHLLDSAELSPVGSDR